MLDLLNDFDSRNDGKSCENHVKSGFRPRLACFSVLGDVLGSISGSLGCLGALLGDLCGPRRRPRAPQEAPKDPPRAPQRPPRASQEALEDPPGTLLGRLGAPGPDLEVILTLRGSISYRCGIDFGVDFRFELACDLPLDSGFELGSHGHGGARRAAIG